MAAPTIVAAAGAHDNLSTNIDTFSWTIPAAAAIGDVALIMVGMNAGAVNPFPVPAGWTEIGTVLNTSGNHNTQAFGKVLVSGDPGATVTTTLATGAGKIHGGGIIIRGAEGIPSNFQTITDTTTGATVAGPGITTDSVDNLIVNFGMIRNTTSTTTKSTITSVTSGWTKRTDTGTANSIAPNFTASIATRNTIQATAGSVTGCTFTSSDTASTGHVWAFAFEPAPVSNVAPTVNAGADQKNIEPYRTVTLTGTASDSDGNISSTSWSQISGSPTVTLSGTGNSRTFTFPGTIAGATLGFRFSATDNSGATSTDDVLVTGLPVTERVAKAGVWEPMQLEGFGDPVNASLRGLGIIGDGSILQGGSGAVRKAFVAGGWPDSLVTVDGLNDRTMSVAGITTPNVGQVIDYWRAQNYDPYTWVFSLGYHNLNATDAAWTTWIGEVLDKVAAGPRASYVVNWVGISLATVGDTRPPRYYNVANALVGTRPKIVLKPINWNSYVHNGRDESGLWDVNDTQGRWMTPVGYNLFNSYIASQVGSAV